MELSPLPPQPQQPPTDKTVAAARLTSKNTTTTSSNTSSNSSSRKSSSSGGGGTNNGSSSFQGSLPLWKRVLVCSGMLALESYITYEEIYLTTTLQRFQVPYALLSVPGAVSGGCGIFMVPLLGWAMDRYKGNKRRFAVGTLTVLSLGMVVLIYTGTTSLYYPDPKLQSTNHDFSFNNSLTGNGTVSANHSVGLDLNEDSSSSSGGSSGGGNHVPVLTGILAMIGFVFSDQGYDTSTLTVRTYILSISPVSQHDSLLLTTTTMGAIGGCITSLVGFLNLSSLFPYVEGQVIDAGDAQFLVQSIIFVITLAVFFTGTLCANSQLFQKETDSFFVLAKTKKNQNGYKPLEGEQLFSIEELETKYLIKDTGTTNNNYDTERTPPTFEMTKFQRGSLPDLTRQDVHSAHDKPEPEFDLKEEAQSTLEEEEPGQCLISKRTKSRLALMLMVFLVIIAMACYFFYITNYVAEIIYKGDPHAPAGSDPYEQYVLGTRVASLSMLTFYVVFVFYNVFHGKILDKIGMRAEFIITSISVTVLTTATVVTQNMIMVFVTMIPLAAYRSCCYTIPFILANKYAQQEHQELKKERKAAHRKGNPERALLPGDTTEEEEEEGEVEVSPTSGSAMASVTVMIPLTYCLVCIAAGPLIALTNDTALPIYVSIGAYGLGTFTAAIVDFD